MDHVDDVLGKLPLFAALDDDANVALRVAMRHENFSRGDVIFDEGDPGTKLFAVIEGKVKLARTAPDGRENLQAVLGPARCSASCRCSIRNRELLAPWR